MSSSSPRSGLLLCYVHERAISHSIDCIIHHENYCTQPSNSLAQKCTLMPAGPASPRHRNPNEDSEASSPPIPFSGLTTQTNNVTTQKPMGWDPKIYLLTASKASALYRDLCLRPPESFWGGTATWPASSDFVDEKVKGTKTFTFS